MTPDEERLRASDARHGAKLLRSWRVAREWGPDALAWAARVITNGRDRRKPIPEGAMDWPIYRAALAPRGGTFAILDGERFEPDGPPDSWWSDTAGDSPAYRRDMRDAGRGGMLR